MEKPGHSLKGQRLQADLGLVRTGRLVGHQTDDPNIVRRSVGSHVNPTDPDFDVESSFPGRHERRHICPTRELNQTNSVSP
jgi:hypothetical protein